MTILISLFLLASCQDTVDKLKRVGRAPDFENIELPTIEADEEEIERRGRVKVSTCSYEKDKLTMAIWFNKAL